MLVVRPVFKYSGEAPVGSIFGAGGVFLLRRVTAGKGRRYANDSTTNVWRCDIKHQWQCDRKVGVFSCDGALYEERSLRCVARTIPYGLWEMLPESKF